MSYDLSCLGIEKDLQYECITTTISKDGVKNAGAFAFQYLGGDKVRCHIFEGSKTLKNILSINSRCTATVIWIKLLIPADRDIKAPLRRFIN